MAINKVVYGDSTLIDLSQDTLASADQLLQGVEAHDRTGATVIGTIEDGDEIGYGSTGETWYLNETLTVMITDFSFLVEFASNNQSYVRLTCSAIGQYGSPLTYDDGSSSVLVYGPRQSPRDFSWLDQAYRTITITGGEDKDDPTFRAWLEANATEVTT